MKSPIPFTPIQFLCIFVVMWLAASAFISAMSGWLLLWWRLPRKEKTDGTLYRFASISLGPNLVPFTIFPVNYNRCLFVRVGKEGLELSMMLPFRFMHPPLFIPWSAVESCREIRILWMRATVLVIAAGCYRMVCREKLGPAVLAAHEAWKSPPPNTGPFDASDSSWNESASRAIIM